MPKANRALFIVFVSLFVASNSYGDQRGVHVSSIVWRPSGPVTLLTYTHTSSQSVVQPDALTVELAPSGQVLLAKINPNSSYHDKLWAAFNARSAVSISDGTMGSVDEQVVLPTAPAGDTQLVLRAQYGDESVLLLRVHANLSGAFGFTAEEDLDEVEGLVSNEEYSGNSRAGAMAVGGKLDHRAPGELWRQLDALNPTNRDGMTDIANSKSATNELVCLRFQVKVCGWCEACGGSTNPMCACCPRDAYFLDCIHCTLTCD